VRTIQVVPLGDADRKRVESLRGPLARVFHARVELRDVACDVELFFDQTRVQYNSTRIIEFLQRDFARKKSTFDDNIPPKVLAVSSEDLFIPILTYVFGEAQLGGEIAVVSYHRLETERYGLPPNPVLAQSRLLKESIHELGHTFGLIHCSAQDCVMHTSTYAEDIDLKLDAFCPICRGILQPG
jgi:archaemetzincin